MINAALLLEPPTTELVLLARDLQKHRFQGFVAPPKTAKYLNDNGVESRILTGWRPDKNERDPTKFMSLFQALYGIASMHPIARFAQKPKTVSKIDRTTPTDMIALGYPNIQLVVLSLPADPKKKHIPKEYLALFSCAMHYRRWVLTDASEWGKLVSWLKNNRSTKAITAELLYSSSKRIGERCAHDTEHFRRVVRRLEG